MTTKPDIPKVPMLGRSWYSRGVGYWLRRARFLFVLLLICVFPVWFATIFVTLIADSTRSWGRVVLLTLIALGFSWSFVLGLRAVLQQRGEERRLLAGEAVPATGSRKGGGATGLALGVAGLGGSPVAALLLFVGQIFVVGWFVPVVVKAFGRYMGPDEIRAVVAVREWYGLHPEIPDGQRPRQFRR